MDDYISREWLIARLGRNLAACNPGTFSEGCYKDAIETVRNAPAADVEPVRRGWWIGLEYDGYADGNPVYDLWECSECGEEVRGESVPETHLFCPNCGAKMDGGAEDAV